MEPEEFDVDQVLQLSTDRLKLEGTLISQPTDSVKGINTAALRGYLVDRNVSESCIDNKALEALCEQIRSAPLVSHEMMIAQGTPAIDGNSATYTLTKGIARRVEAVQARKQAIQEGAITSETTESPTSEPPSEVLSPEHKGTPGLGESTMSHYDQMSFVVVHQGEIIAHKTEPSKASDGRDIFGESIPANDEKSNEVELDDSIQLAPDGTCTAKISGVLTALPNHIAISNHLDIQEDVDFQTGRIIFPGSVSVAGSVRDRFCVRATGKIEIHGLVEAADLESEQSISLFRGMAGKESGLIKTRRDLSAGYLEAVIGQIQGNANVAGEITNCTLTIRGELNAKAAALRGGTVELSKSSWVGSIGSAQGVKTVILIGALPEIENQIREADTLIKRLEKQITHDVAKKAQVEAAISKATPLQVKDIAERQSEIDKLQTKLHELTGSRNDLIDLIAKHSAPRLEIEKAIYAKVILYLPGYRAEFTNDLIGVSVINIGADGQPAITHLSKSGPLSAYAKVTMDNRILKAYQSKLAEAA